MNDQSQTISTLKEFEKKLLRSSVVIWVDNHDEIKITPNDKIQPGTIALVYTIYADEISREGREFVRVATLFNDNWSRFYRNSIEAYMRVKRCYSMTGWVGFHLKNNFLYHPEWAYTEWAQWASRIESRRKYLDGFVKLSETEWVVCDDKISLLHDHWLYIPYDEYDEVMKKIKGIFNIEDKVERVAIIREIIKRYA